MRTPEHELSYQAVNAQTQRYTPTYGSTSPVFIMHSCQKGAGAVSAVCLASAQSSHMFSEMWEFELAQGGLRSSTLLISLSLHTNPAVFSMQVKGGGLVGYVLYLPLCFCISNE